MDALVINITSITLDFISRKITPGPGLKIKENIIGRKRGPDKTIFGPKSGPAMAGPSVPPTTALYWGRLFEIKDVLLVNVSLKVLTK